MLSINIVDFLRLFFEKGLKFVPDKRGGPIILDLGFILLPAESGSFPEKRGYKSDAFINSSSSNFEIILPLLTKLITFHGQVFIV